MKRGYQHNYSSQSPEMSDVSGRERKAKTMVAVLTDYCATPLGELSALDVGGSTGIIDNHLADYFRSVVGVDIDEPAIESAKSRFQKANLTFQVADALNLPFSDGSFDVVVCSQVYEHVPDAHRMLEEIFRVLVPGGACYFAAGNRLMWREPPYNLPLLSVIPRRLAHVYIRLMGKASHYHEQHFTYWGLKKLARRFIIHDYTRELIADPDKYHAGYMVRPGSAKAWMAKLIVSCFLWLCPGYIWVLEKPGKT